MLHSNQIFTIIINEESTIHYLNISKFASSIADAFNFFGFWYIRFSDVFSCPDYIYYVRFTQNIDIFDVSQDTYLSAYCYDLSIHFNRYYFWFFSREMDIHNLDFTLYALTLQLLL